MKKRTIMPMLILMVSAACQNSNKSLKEVPLAVVIEKHMYCIVADASKSYKFGSFDSTDVFEFVWAVALHGGGVIEAIQVTDRSLLQNPVTVVVPNLCDTIIISNNNLFTTSRNRAKNKEHKAQVEKELQTSAMLLLTALHPNNNYDFSDINGMLELCNAIISQSIYKKGYSITVVIASDLSCDMPTGNKRINPVRFENARLCLIRPAISLRQITDAFPASQPDVYISSHDFIQSIR